MLLRELVLWARQTIAEAPRVQVESRPGGARLTVAVGAGYCSGGRCNPPSASFSSSSPISECRREYAK